MSTMMNSMNLKHERYEHALDFCQGFASAYTFLRERNDTFEENKDV